jgi:hypothetical protein
MYASSSNETPHTQTTFDNANNKNCFDKNHNQEGYLWSIESTTKLLLQKCDELVELINFDV